MPPYSKGTGVQKLSSAPTSPSCIPTAHLALLDLDGGAVVQPPVLSGLGGAPHGDLPPRGVQPHAAQAAGDMHGLC